MTVAVAERSPEVELGRKVGIKQMISIVTPSFQQLDWLRLAVASVADQQGIDVEHIVQDAETPGVQEFLETHFDSLLESNRLRLCVEKDDGMYDAVNRGYRRATGDILAYLNCDEQYLPGALKTVQDFFDSHPHIEVALAGSIVTNGEGHYLCHRHLMTPHPHGVWVRFPILTSSVFIRRKVIFERGIFFDPRWRDLGDFHWMLALMKNKVPMAVCDSVTSVFADTGENMNLKPNASREMAETKAMIPAWVRPLKAFWILHHRLRRLAAGHFNTKPTSYSIYTLLHKNERQTFRVAMPTGVWRNRL